LLNEDDEKEGIAVSSRLFALLLLGLALVFVGIVIIVVVSVVLGGSSSVGGVILIGPIPIIFGAGPESEWLIALGAVLSVISVVLFIIINKRARRA